jgi:hypothetical protein
MGVPLRIRGPRTTEGREHLVEGVQQSLGQEALLECWTRQLPHYDRSNLTAAISSKPNASRPSAATSAR